MTTFTGPIPTIASGDTTTVPTNLAVYRDALKALSESWTAYGSATSWTATTTNPVLNNGTWAGFYMQVGKLVHFRVTITIGSTTTFGSGAYRFALPVAAATDVAQIGRTIPASYRDASPATTGQFVVEYISATTVGGGSPTSPITFASGDKIFLDGVYEAA